jgi:hypothetical protein
MLGELPRALRAPTPDRAHRRHQGRLGPGGCGSPGRRALRLAPAKQCISRSKRRPAMHSRRETRARAQRSGRRVRGSDASPAAERGPMGLAGRRRSLRPSAAGSRSGLPPPLSPTRPPPRAPEHVDQRVVRPAPGRRRRRAGPQ